MEPERVARELRNAWLVQYQLQDREQEIRGPASQQETGQVEEQAMQMLEPGCA
jgi:hypothetical protein